ncbi:MAG: hypothetical protein P8Y60_18625 [Calditrichota bacterium]
MNCSEFESRLSEYVDGDLPTAGRKLFVQHRDNFKNALAAIHSLPKKKTSLDFDQRLFARINEIEQHSFWDKLFGLMPNHLFPRYAMAMALATVILFVGYRAIEDNMTLNQPDSSIIPPPSLNIPQQVTIFEQQPTDLLNSPIPVERDTHDTNQILPQERRSYEGQIRYVKGSQ